MTDETPLILVSAATDRHDTVVVRRDVRDRPGRWQRVPTEIPAGLESVTAWSADRFRAAAESVRLRVLATVLAHRCGAHVAPERLDDICTDLVEITRRSDAGAGVRLGPDDASAIREASSMITTCSELVAGLIEDVGREGR